MSAFRRSNALIDHVCDSPRPLPDEVWRTRQGDRKVRVLAVGTRVEAVSTDWRAYFCKACDRLDNLQSLGQTTPEFRLKQVTETRDKYFRLFDRMVTLTPPEYQDGVRRLRDEIHRTTEEIQGMLTSIQP